jgi:hypothetical protein
VDRLVNQQTRMLLEQCRMGPAESQALPSRAGVASPGWTPSGRVTPRMSPSLRQPGCSQGAQGGHALGECALRCLGLLEGMRPRFDVVGRTDQLQQAFDAVMAKLGGSSASSSAAFQLPHAKSTRLALPSSGGADAHRVMRFAQQLVDEVSNRSSADHMLYRTAFPSGRMRDVSELTRRSR